MTTGTSAPPIDAVMCQPRLPERANMPRAARLVGETSAMKRPMRLNMPSAPAMFMVAPGQGERGGREVLVELADERARRGRAADDGRELMAVMRTPSPPWRTQWPR